MLFIVHDADFSANNIGQVELPIEWDLDAAAYKLAIPIAGAALSSNKNRALNNFFKGLKTNAIWGKITNLYLPIFGQAEGGVNLKNPSQSLSLPTDAAWATYDSKGVFFLKGWASGVAKNTSNAHMGAYNTTIPKDSNDVLHISMAVSNSDFQIGRRMSASFAGGAIWNSSLTRTTIPNHFSTIGLILGSNNSALAKTEVMMDGEYSFNAQTYNGTSASSIIFGGHTNNSNTGFGNASYGLFTIGAYLTQAEMTIYNSLVTNLMTALLAA